MREERNFHLTPEGLEKIRGEYEILKRNRGLELLELRLAELDNVLKNAVLIRPPAREKRGIVGLGARVKIEGNSRNYEFEIVGSLETNPSRGRISNESPVGRALLGRRVGEEVVISSSAKAVYKIREIKYDSPFKQ